jgi:hypothetical protein
MSKQIKLFEILLKVALSTIKQTNKLWKVNKWWSTIPPISTKPTITSYLNSLNMKGPRHITWEPMPWLATPTQILFTNTRRTLANCFSTYVHYLFFCNCVCLTCKCVICKYTNQIPFFIKNTFCYYLDRFLTKLIFSASVV